MFVIFTITVTMNFVNTKCIECMSLNVEKLESMIENKAH